MEPSATFLHYMWQLLAVLALVMLNGFFVAAEFALVGVRRARIEALAQKGNRTARRLLTVLGELNAYLSASQLGITLASLALGWIGEPVIAEMIEAPLTGRVSDVVRHSLAFAIAFTLITALHIVVGEQAPKLLGLQRAERVALAVTLPMQLFYRTFAWPIRALDWASARSVRLIGLHATSEHASAYTAEELSHLIDLSRKGGQLQASQGAIVSQALEFSGLTVRDAMVPRPQVITVNDQATLDEIVRRLRESEYSRLPVYRDTIDNITGVIHSKDVLAFWDKREDFALEKIMHPPNFVPDSMRLDAVLKRMQESHFHFAIVTDEHGGVDGIITLEDLLEEIVGEIEDEFDEEAHRLVTKRSDGSFMLDGTLPLRSANRRLGLDLPEEESYHTLAGFLMAQAGRILKTGDRVEYGNAEFIVERADRHRIRAVRMTVNK